MDIALNSFLDTQKVEGLEDFDVTSEQYYLHVDPALEVLATTRFPTVEWYHSTNAGKLIVTVRV